MFGMEEDDDDDDDDDDDPDGSNWNLLSACRHVTPSTALQSPQSPHWIASLSSCGTCRG